MLTIVTGPVRSGKSERAAVLAGLRGGPVILAATAAVDPGDREMTDRVARHRADRRPDWNVVETSAGGTDTLAGVLAGAPPEATVVVDALGTWLAAHMLRCEDAIEADTPAAQAQLDALCAELVEAIAACRAHVIVVAEAVGWDVVPPSAQGRVFRDVLGRATRLLAERAGRVELVVAGIPLVLRDVDSR